VGLVLGAMLPGWASAPEWYPGKQGDGIRPMELHFMIKEALDYPNGIVTSVDIEYHEPVRAGDSVRVEQILREVSEERSTRLGPGRNWTIDVVFRRQDGVLLGVQAMAFLGYRSGAAVKEQPRIPNSSWRRDCLSVASRSPPSPSSWVPLRAATGSPCTTTWCGHDRRAICRTSS